ncbi:hypothetical protein ACFSUM_14775 [Virgibacillus siamensis]
MVNMEEPVLDDMMIIQHRFFVIRQNSGGAWHHPNLSGEEKI